MCQGRPRDAKLMKVDVYYMIFIYFYFFPIIFINWRLITLQYCSGFCHTLTWISHGVTCIPHPDPPSHLPLHPIPLGLPSAPGLSTCLMHPAWVGDLYMIFRKKRNSLFIAQVQMVKEIETPWIYSHENGKIRDFTDKPGRYIILSQPQGT